MDNTPEIEPTGLERQDIVAVFERLNAYLAERNKSLELVLIGSAILIVEGMPNRCTQDIDVWRTGRAKDEALLREAAEACGTAVNPEHQDPLVGHLSLVGNDFIGFPDYALWKDETETFWSGSHLTLKKPPVGIMLGSKIAAWRSKDFADISWILDTAPHWQESLDRFGPHFDKHAIKRMAINIDLFEYLVETRKRPMIADPETHAADILPRKKAP